MHYEMAAAALAKADKHGSADSSRAVSRATAGTKRCSIAVATLKSSSILVQLR